MNKFVKLATVSVAASLVGSGLAFAAEPPTEHQGVSVYGRAALELGAQIPAMEGYQLRVRQVVVETGGVVAFHSHDTRPGAYYVVKGNAVREFQGADDETGRIVSPGQAVLEDQGTDHWIKNEGDEAIFFVLDIVPVE